MPRKPEFDRAIGEYRVLSSSEAAKRSLTRAGTFPPAGVVPAIWSRTITRQRGRRTITETHAITDGIALGAAIVGVGLLAAYEAENVAGKLPGEITGFFSWVSGGLQSAGKKLAAPAAGGSGPRTIVPGYSPPPWLPSWWPPWL